MNKPLAILLIFSTCFALALGDFKCYKKTSGENDEMGTAEGCPTDTKNCKKTITVMDGKTTYAKDCGTKTDETEGCKEDKSNSAKVVTTCYCKTSECNPASRNVLATLTILAVVALNCFL